MKLFLRDHISLVLLNACQLLIILVILVLNGYHNIGTALYAILLCVVTLTLYLLYRYYRRRHFYRRLSRTMQSLDDATQHYGYSAPGEALTELLQAQYSIYQERLLHYQQRQEKHLIFTNQWVHQMKTPLSVIFLITQDNDDARFASIREEAEKMQGHLSMVLYTARLNTFEKDFRVDAIDLRQLIETVIQDHKRLFIRNGVYPEVDVDAKLTVFSDQKWLAFILEQLITNAVKYSVGKSKKIRLSASVLDQQRIELMIQDHGIGIPTQDLPQIFEAYFTGENGRTHRQSTGMGLFLVYEACQQLGHSITVESQVDQGTTMRLIFRRQVRKLTPL